MIELMEGFESAIQAAGGHRFLTSTMTGGEGTAYGRNGGRGWRSGIGQSILIPLTANRADVFICVGIRPTFGHNLDMQVIFSNGYGRQLALQSNFADNSFDLYRYPYNDILDITGPAIVTTGVYQFLEVHYVGEDTTGGVVEIKVDGIVKYTLTSAQTTFSIDGCSSIELMIDGDIDDLCVISTAGGGLVTYIGDGTIVPLRPTGAGTHSDGVQTGGTPGNPYTAVNEIVPDDDTSYVTLSNTGDIQSFLHSGITVPVIAVKALQIITKARLESAGAAQQAGLIRTAGADYVGAVSAVPASYSPLATMFEKNPNGTVDWTRATVNAAEIGSKKTL